LYGDSLKKIKVSVCSHKEQAKIATFLSLLDQRIETQSIIIEKYESLIKGISDLLLYSKSYPLRRVHLGSLCSIKKGEQVNALELTSAGSYYVMNGGMLPSGYYPQYNTNADTISISEGGNSCGYVQYNFSKFWSGGHCYTLNEISKQIFNKYLYYYLKSQEKNIQALRVGSGLPNIQKKDLERVEVQFPDYEEQEKVVKILTLFSQKIELEYRLLSVIQKQKEYLLQQMFI
jgi:type I restriction enzyme S subunit